MNKVVYGIIMLMTSIGCSGQTIKYKKYGEGLTSRVGYSDFEIGKNKYKVTYTGGVHDNQQTVMKYAYKRANELCNEKGFSETDVTNTDLNSQVSSTSTQNYGSEMLSFTDTKSQKIYSLDVQCK